MTQVAPAPVLDFDHELLLTDLYQLSMIDAYLATNMEERAVFEFFVRKLPASRGFLMATGLEQVVTFLQGARCSVELLRQVSGLMPLKRRTLDFLENFAFSGDVDALPEGTVFFPGEPVVRVTAPIAEAQLVETRLINFLQFQSLVASKAARMVLAAPGKSLIDFGLRRAHSGEAGVLASRAAYIAGFSSTATVPAATRFGIPASGTMAHSFVQAHPSEEEAFLSFARTRPGNVVFLIDTFDTLKAAEKVTRIAPTLAAEGIAVRAVRLDSGELGALSREVRRILDNAGLGEVKIIASGGIDEFELAKLKGAPIDAFGIGTSLVTSEDVPAVDCAYKLKAYGGRALRKRSTGKAYWPGPTQVFRRYGAKGEIAGDLIARAEERQEGEALLKPVMRQGKLLAPLPSLDAIQRLAAAELKRLPTGLTALEPRIRFVPEVSPGLRALAEEVDRHSGSAA